MADKKPEPKKYTLEEAYAEIIRIKNEMVRANYHNEAEERAFNNGYRKAIEDVQLDFIKRSNLLGAIRG